jgi:hypothetical protein
MGGLARAAKWQILRAAPVEEVKYSPSWSVGTTADNVYEGTTYGNIWQAPQDFKLSAIEVPLGRHATIPVCTNGIIQIYHNPVCNGIRGTLIGSATKVLPSLPVTPNYIWVKFDFDPAIAITNGETYCYLAVGCAPYPTEPFYRIMVGGDIDDGITGDRAIWRGHFSPPYLYCVSTFTCPFKLYKERNI